MPKSVFLKILLNFRYKKKGEICVNKAIKFTALTYKSIDVEKPITRYNNEAIAIGKLPIRKLQFNANIIILVSFISLLLISSSTLFAESVFVISTLVRIEFLLFKNCLYLIISPSVSMRFT